MQPPDLSRTLFIDFETRVGPGLTLSEMTLAQYLDATDVTSSAWAIGEDEPSCVVGQPTQDMLNLWARIGADPLWVVVAHNAAFDLRVWYRKLGLPAPARARCSMEIARAALPSHPGGYSLGYLAECFDLPAKLAIDFAAATPEQLAEYNKHDAVLCREIYRRCTPHLTAKELRISELCQAVRELRFQVDAGRVSEAMESFATAAGQSYASAVELFGADAAKRIFNVDGEGEDAVIRSVRTAELRKVLASQCDFDEGTTSLKKINPEALRANPKAHARLKTTSQANRYLTQKRNTTTFHGVKALDVELGYAAAHTLRFSSAQPGCKGANLHNLPKRDKVLAKAMRGILRLPDSLCWVRADLANVEYRVQQKMLGNAHAERMFSADVFADPYLSFGKEATGLSYPKSHPIRQAFKESVLGLGYLMGLPRFVGVLQMAMANSQLDKDPGRHLTDAVLAGVCADKQWAVPRGKYFTKVRNATGATDAVLSVAHHLRERFHEIHPETKVRAAWFQDAADAVASHPEPGEWLADQLRAPDAPDPRWCRPRYVPDEYGPGTRSIRLGCGLWGHDSVLWRDLAVRDMPNGGACLTLVCAGKKPPKPVSPNLLIENWAQSASRNALCEGVLALADKEGYPYILHVHDEILIAVPRDPEALWTARQALLKVFGPGGTVAQAGWEWACVINPDEITVSASLYEIQQSPDWWDRISRGEASLLGELP